MTAYLMMAAGAYWIWVSLIVEVENGMSLFLVKVVSLILAVCLLAVGIVDSGLFNA